jgi:Short C-terminal domain
MGLFGKSKQDKAADLVQTGTRAVGTVLNVVDTGVTMNDNPRVQMAFRIEPLDGSPAFEAEKTKVVSRVQIPRSGDRYPVWYDAADPSTWAFAFVDNEEGRDNIRQMFGAAAETMTGVGNPAAAAAAPAAPAAAEDPLDRLKKLDELHKAGVVTDAEFEAKKADLLSDL